LNSASCGCAGSLTPRTLARRAGQERRGATIFSTRAHSAASRRARQTGARRRGALPNGDCSTIGANFDELAQESAIDYAETDEPLGTYVDQCDPIWPNCECNWNAQAEVQVARYGLDWLEAIEHGLSESRFARAYLEFEVTHVGIGFWISGDEAWIALSFS
jgi:hypothetical protein